MSHGEFKGTQAATVAGFVKGKVVHDLGCGDLTLARELVRVGAEKVIAIDKAPFTFSKIQGIESVSCYFDAYRDTVETAFLSWPVNWYDYGLNQLIEQAKTVIYLGSNLDGSACGYKHMWMFLRTREILAHVPNQKNNLIVYGPKIVVRDPVPEEMAALNQERIYSFTEVYGSGVLSSDANRRTGS